MMICPKCQFQQPPDTYCANCGVNMETFRPKAKPLFSRILKHWIFHLSLLVLVILGLVLYDRSDSRRVIDPDENSESMTSQDAPVSDNSYEPAPQKVAQAEATSLEQDSLAKAQLRSGEKISARAAAPSATAQGKTSVQVTFYQASKMAVSELLREAQNSSFNGEASGGIVNKKKLQQLKDAREVRSTSSSVYKDFDNQHPIMIFKGQRGSGRNLGLFFQLSALREDSGSQQFEVKSWGSLKIQGPEDNLFASEMTLGTQSAAFIAGFLPKDRNFNEEEKAIFEAERTLKIYNQEDFWEGASDLIMVIELVPAA